MGRVNRVQAETANVPSPHQSRIQESLQKKMIRQRAKGREVNHVLQTEGPDVEAIPTSLRGNHQTVLVTMYQFLDFHGLRMCQSLLV